MKYTLPILILICTAAKGQTTKQVKMKRQEVTVNSDCRYWEMTYPAKVIKLLPIGGPSIYDGPLDISFEINMPGNIKDTVYYNAIMGEHIETKEILKNKIEVGKIYRYITQSIISGSCPAMKKKILLKLFNSP
jgi:hypothetical protein